MSVVLLQTEETKSEHSRVAAFCALLARMNAVSFDTRPSVDDAGSRVTKLVEMLGAKGVLRFTAAEDGADGPLNVWYSPSVEARRGFAQDASWPDKITKKQKSAVRVSQGAIFRFPREDKGPSIECFITDWSPFPAACAIAVYPGHPASIGAANRVIVGFTGRYVRHPLVGDLLPIWSAPWVKPDFGTGAVIVNPAHSAMDLKFAREVGLPVRFGLAGALLSPDPTTWPEPPYVKSGIAVRTGICDGQPFAAAAEQYLRSLTTAGAAELTADNAVGHFKLAQLHRGEGGHQVAADLRTGTITAASSDSPTEMRFRLVPTALASSLADAVLSSTPPMIVVANEDIETALLALRLALLDVERSDVRGSSIRIVQRADARGQTTLDQTDFSIAALLASDLAEVGAIKQQQIDQVARFRKLHEKLLARAGDGERGEPAKVQAALCKVRSIMEAGKYRDAISQFLTAQKSIAEDGPESPSGITPLAPYFAVAFVISGLEAPVGVDLGSAWRALKS